ncbi:type I restriction enzyme EcoKI subunit R [Bacillus freudenreichii]|nr:type I restriction enzyme EcoKI subunit R [Bacillus freudenreichii]
MRKNNAYFYKFLEPISKELAYLARELENSIYSSPRMMLTHARTFAEAILQQVMLIEKVADTPYMTLKERIDLLSDNEYLNQEMIDALHFIRMSGNKAAHDTRKFRYSEALLSWEAIYTVVQWYIEVYGPVELDIPEYQDPEPNSGNGFEIAELEARLKNMENLIKASLTQQQEGTGKDEVAATAEEAPQETELPGFTTIRTITYKEKSLEVPYFLRDAFLLPQRFEKSERFLVKLGAEQEARIMSELPRDLEGLHKHVKRYNEKNDENLFEELKIYIKEETARRKTMLDRPGELFLFYKEDYVIVTEELAKVPLTTEEFTGSPSLFRQLNQDQIEAVGQLPRELVILAKYENVGVGTIEKLFEQLKERQGV